jgi:hypothetical protein
VVIGRADRCGFSRSDDLRRSCHDGAYEVAVDGEEALCL